MITYAQNFEDVLLARLFKGRSEGFYIDVGAWHPTLHSVTRYFYDLGWSGINVEPIPGQYQLFVEARPRDININAAVGEVPGQLTFHECKDLTSLSTANAKQAELLRVAGHQVEFYEVPVITLDEIFASCVGRTIDFLKVDVEGYEAAVLKGTDWSHCRPRVLLIEATLPAVKIEDWDNVDSVRNWDSWEPGLLGAGYEFAWFDGLSRFYVRREDHGLKRRLFLPPCVHDEFEPAEVSQLKANYAELIRDREEILSVNRRLVDELEEQRNFSQKLIAKELVIESLAIQELERKALLCGSADLLYRWRRQHGPPSYGEFIPSEIGTQGTHVAVDTLQIIFGVSGGVETYMKMLASALINSGKRVTLICLPDQLSALRKRFESRVGYFVMRQSPAIRSLIKASNRLSGGARGLNAATSLATFTRLREDIGADVLHSPVQMFSMLDFRIPSVLNLHDLQHLHFPENFRPSDIEARDHLYGLSSSLADAIVVSSDFVRNDLREKMAVAPSKVFTIPVTWDPMVVGGLKKFGVEDAIALYRLPPLYAIYPAQFWPHKNHVRLVEALRIVRDKRPEIDLKLVFTGYRGHSGWPKVKEAIAAQGLENHIFCLDHVPVEHLAALYRGSIFCVMPSTFEASSYPVIESQVLGVPAMCSNVTSLPELMREGAGLLFDPFNVDDIAAKMLRWLDDPEDRKDHVERARMKVQREHSVESYILGLETAYQYAVATKAGMPLAITKGSVSGRP
ncbi:MAG: FkbM family methyltransferase [Nitrospira sp. LK70]|nr:FkbM family methyltransferase [Nitrospira sp. LK70]